MPYSWHVSFSQWVSKYWYFVNLRTHHAVNCYTAIMGNETWFFNFSHSLRWRHNRRDGVPNHQPHECLLNRLFGSRSKKTSKPRVTGLCAGNSPGTGEFPAQMASDAETVSIWWRHHVVGFVVCPMRTPGPIWMEFTGIDQRIFFYMSATSTHFKWELMLYCLYCPTLNKVFLVLLLLNIY